MSPFLESAKSRIFDFWSGRNITQRVFLGGLSVLAVGSFLVLAVWLGGEEYGLLYADLTPQDAANVIKALETEKVDYKLEKNGSAVMVPEDRVHALRISIAGQNIMTGQGVGFEIFDDVKVGQTDFVQKLFYRRALEGELARTISEFPGVESARVHLVVPNRSLFIEEQQKPSASVLLKLSGMRKMERSDIEALVNLVTMAVEGLDKGKVSIADTNGKSLYQPEEEGSLDGLTRTQHDYKMTAQRTLERRIEEMLMPVVGAGRVIARVNAELDFSRKTIRRELFDPEKTVVRSETRSETGTQGRAAIEGGVPDPNFRGDGPSGTVSNQNSTSENRSTNFEINKEEQNIVSDVGTVDRLSVAVVVDGNYEKNDDGTSVFAPRSAEEMQRIRQLVANAVGYDSARGDTLEVSNIAFQGVELDAPKGMAGYLADNALRFGKPLLNALLAFLFLLLIVRPVIMALIRPKVEGTMLEGIEGLEGLAAADERLALMEDDEEAVAATAMLEKLEDIKVHAMQLSEQNIEQAIGILRSWLKTGGTAVPASVPAKAA
ncbi:MAG: flagellar M-ring protein FliF [Desulfovibrio sp.]|jgi:flagellar M-ring protein FliF|nr:flagellar M-ring protein FliF [Desulfovibrio sp.]